MYTEKAIVLVSVGTTHLKVLDRTTNKLAEKIKERFPEYEVHQAFSSERILKMMQEKQPDTFDSVEEMLEKLLARGVGKVILQPTYIINGQEQERLRAIVKEYQEDYQFDCIRIGRPLFNAKEDYQKALEAILEIADLKEGEALLLVGHGTNHHANTEYQNLEYTAYVQGHRNVFVATLEGPQKLMILMRKLEITGCKKIKLMPLLFVAGKHAKNDIAGKENSWKTRLEDAGYEVEPLLIGLGEMDKIQDLFVEHLDKIVR